MPKEYSFYGMLDEINKGKLAQDLKIGRGTLSRVIAALRAQPTYHKGPGTLGAVYDFYIVRKIKDYVNDMRRSGQIKRGQYDRGKMAR